METRSRKQKRCANALRVKPLKLRLYTDEVLRRRASPVNIFDSSLENFIREMIRFMKAHNGVGLAASQVGVSYQIIVADIGDAPLAIVNPQYIQKKGADIMSEGCLSVPKCFVDIKRSTSIVVAGRDVYGGAIEVESFGLMARVIQHEIDHLSGILILDYNVSLKEE